VVKIIDAKTREAKILETLKTISGKIIAEASVYIGNEIMNFIPGSYVIKEEIKECFSNCCFEKIFNKDLYYPLCQLTLNIGSIPGIQFSLYYKPKMKTIFANAEFNIIRSQLRKLCTINDSIGPGIKLLTWEILDDIDEIIRDMENVMKI